MTYLLLFGLCSNLKLIYIDYDFNVIMYKNSNIEGVCMDSKDKNELPPILQNIIGIGFGVGFCALMVFWIVSAIFESPSTVDYDPYDNLQFINSIYKGSDMNCDDFASAWEAQQFYEANGPRDPHDLDRDGDGRACEW